MWGNWSYISGVPRRNRRNQPPSQQAQATYAAVAAAKLILTGDGPTADTQDDNSTIEQVEESDGNNRDPEPTVMEYEKFPMDAAPRMETGNFPAPSPQPPHHSRLEVTETPTEMTADP